MGVRPPAKPCGGAEGEHLVGRELAAVEIAAREPQRLLDVGRHDKLDRAHRIQRAGQRRLDKRERAIAQGSAFFVRPAAVEERGGNAAERER